MAVNVQCIIQKQQFDLKKGAAPDKTKLCSKAASVLNCGFPLMN